MECNEKNVKKPMLQLRNFFKNNIIVTLGEHGSACITSQGDYYRIPAIRVNSIDSTGAGDAFIGGFIYGLVQNKDIYSCITFGNISGALAVMKEGAQASLPYENEFKDFLKKENINYTLKDGDKVNSGR